MLSLMAPESLPIGIVQCFKDVGRMLVRQAGCLG